MATKKEKRTGDFAGSEFRKSGGALRKENGCLGRAIGRGQICDR